MTRHGARRRLGGLIRTGMAVGGILLGTTAHADPEPCPPAGTARPARPLRAWFGWLADRCATIPPGAMPAPPGAYVRQWQELQAAAAEQDDFVIYRNEWYLGGMILGPYGSQHLNQIGKRLPAVPFPVVLEPCAQPEVNAVRRRLVVQALLQCGVTDAEARVVVGFPQAEGLYGVEAARVYNQLLMGSGTSGGFGGGTLGGGGFGGGFGGGGILGAGSSAGGRGPLGY